MANFIDWRKRSVSDGNGAMYSYERVRRLRQADVLHVNVSMYVVSWTSHALRHTGTTHAMHDARIYRYIRTKIEITRCLACEGMSGVYEAGLSIADSWPCGVTASRRGSTGQRKRKSWLRPSLSSALRFTIFVACFSLFRFPFFLSFCFLSFFFFFFFCFVFIRNRYSVISVTIRWSLLQWFIIYLVRLVEKLLSLRFFERCCKNLHLK